MRYITSEVSVRRWILKDNDDDANDDDGDLDDSNKTSNTYFAVTDTFLKCFTHINRSNLPKISVRQAWLLSSFIKSETERKVKEHLLKNRNQLIEERKFQVEE